MKKKFSIFTIAWIIPVVVLNACASTITTPTPIKDAREIATQSAATVQARLTAYKESNSTNTESNNSDNGNNSISTQISPQSSQLSIPKIDIQITDTEMVELEPITILQPNCNGTAEVENTSERSRTIQYIMEVQNGVSINANGQIGFAGTDIELGASVASQFGQSYGTSETLARSITVKAKAGTSMQHIIRQVEIWKIGTAKISVGSDQITLPFRFRTDFGIELVKSQNIYPNQYLRQLWAGGWLKNRVNSAQTSNLLKDFFQ